MKKEYLNWLQKDQAAQGLMKGASDPTQWPHVSKAATLKGMWEAWRKLYVMNQQPLNVHYWFEDLYTRKYNEVCPWLTTLPQCLTLDRRSQGLVKHYLTFTLLMPWCSH